MKSLPVSDAAVMLPDGHPYLNAVGLATLVSRHLHAGPSVVFPSSGCVQLFDMANATIEGRLTNLEQEMADLKRRLQLTSALPQPSANWLDAVIGSFENEPAFDEVLALGRIARNADRPDEGR